MPSDCLRIFIGKDTGVEKIGKSLSSTLEKRYRKVFVQTCSRWIEKFLWILFQKRLAGLINQKRLPGYIIQDLPEIRNRSLCL